MNDPSLKDGCFLITAIITRLNVLINCRSKKSPTPIIFFIGNMIFLFTEKESNLFTIFAEKLKILQNESKQTIYRIQSLLDSNS